MLHHHGAQQLRLTAHPAQRFAYLWTTMFLRSSIRCYAAFAKTWPLSQAAIRYVIRYEGPILSDAGSTFLQAGSVTNLKGVGAVRGIGPLH